VQARYELRFHKILRQGAVLSQTKLAQTLSPFFWYLILCNNQQMHINEILFNDMLSVNKITCFCCFIIYE
jgi:hypothetical protein